MKFLAVVVNIMKISKNLVHRGSCEFGVVAQKKFVVPWTVWSAEIVWLQAGIGRAIKGTLISSR